MAVQQATVGDQLRLKRVAGRIGAVVEGVRLGGDIDDATAEAIKAALARHKVLFFRGQGHLDDQSQEAFAARIGEPVGHPTLERAKGSSYMLELNSERGGRAASWHTDVTFVDAYPMASILRAVTIPEYGGDTVWANTATAYDDLSPELKTLADGLRAIHTNLYDYAGSRKDLTPEAIERHRKVFASTVYETEHPVVRVHPVTGEKNLLLGHFLKSFVGLSSADTARLFGIFQDHVTRLENCVRWGWTEGDVAIWENRSTQHYAINDYGNQKRVMRRITLMGDVPVGVDGRRSVMRSPAQPSAVAAE